MTLTDGSLIILQLWTCKHYICNMVLTHSQTAKSILWGYQQSLHLYTAQHIRRMQSWLPNNEIPKVHKRTRWSQTIASTENCKESLKELLRRMLEANLKKNTILLVKVNYNYCKALSWKTWREVFINWIKDDIETIKFKNFTFIYYK